MHRSARPWLPLIRLTAEALVIATVATPGCGVDTDAPLETRSSAVSSDPTDWLQSGGGPTHSGFNSAENTITPSVVWQLRKAFDPPTLLGGGSVSAPIVASSVSIPNQGVHDVAYATTTQGLLVAVDAFSGAFLWDNSGEQRTAFPSVYGFAPSPAIDPGKQFVYAAQGDGKIHKYPVGGGPQITTGWPVAFTTKMSKEPIVTSLTIGNGVTSQGYLYVGSGGCDVNGPMDCQGHVTIIKIDSGGRTVFNAMCSSTSGLLTSCPQINGGIWARGGVTFDPVTQRLYAVTGNGTFDPLGHSWGDSVIALNPNGSGGAPAGNGYPVDSFTPTDQASRNGSDFDLGSTNMLILPTSNGSRFAHLGFVTGRGGKAYLVNLDDMSGQGGPGHTGNVAEAQFPPLGLATGGANVVRPIALWTNPADGSSWFFVNSNGGMNAIKLVVTNGTPSLVTAWTRPGSGGGAFVAKGILYYHDGTSLLGCDAATGALMWSWPIDSGPGMTPVVVKGVLYFGLTGFRLVGMGDLAWQKSPVQSSTFTGGDAWKGTDLNETSTWSGNSIFHTFADGPTTLTGGLAGGPWWFVDLGQVRTIDQIVLWNRTDACCVGRFGGFRINYWNGSQWVQASDQTNTTTSAANPVLSIGVNFTAEWFMIQKTNVDYLHLAEVMAFGH